MGIGPETPPFIFQNHLCNKNGRLLTKIRISSCIMCAACIQNSDEIICIFRGMLKPVMVINQKGDFIHHPMNGVNQNQSSQDNGQVILTSTTASSVEEKIISFFR